MKALTMGQNARLTVMTESDREITVEVTQDGSVVVHGARAVHVPNPISNHMAVDAIYPKMTLGAIVRCGPGEIEAELCCDGEGFSLKVPDRPVIKASIFTAQGGTLLLSGSASAKEIVLAKKAKA